MRGAPKTARCSPWRRTRPTTRPSSSAASAPEAYTALTSAGNHAAALQQGDLRRRTHPARRGSCSRPTPGLGNGQITPRHVAERPRATTRCPTAETASGAKCSFDGFERKAYGTVNLVVGPHQVERRLLLQARRRHVAPARPARRRRAGHGPTRKWGFGADSGLGLPGEADGRVPDPEWLRAYAEDAVRGQPGQDRGLRHLAVRRQPQHGDRPGRRAGHAAAAGQRLRHLRQRRHPLRPQLVLQVAKYESDDGRCRSPSPKPVRTIDMQPDWRAGHPRGAEGRHQHGGDGTAAAPSSGFPQDRVREWPARRARPRSDRQGQHLAVRRVRPGRRCPRSSRSPSSRSRAPAARRRRR